MFTDHVATILAYPIKAEMGGGFRGVYFDRNTKERIASPCAFPTLEGARHWAKMEAHKRHSEYSLAPLRRSGEYQANVWIRV